MSTIISRGYISSKAPFKHGVYAGFLAFLFFLSLYPAVLASASDVSSPLHRLKNGFFPKYLSKAYASYLNSNNSKCSEQLDSLTINAYTTEPEKYFLLKALCAPKEKQPNAAKENITLALKEKGSSSDILYAAAIIYSQLEINDEAIKNYSEAIWFNNFKKFDAKDFYFDLGTLQHKLAMLGESKTSLEKAQTLGESSIDLKYMLCDIAIKTGDRRTAITLARQLTTQKSKYNSKEMLMLALMVSADPVFNKRDIKEASSLAAQIPESSIKKADIGVAAVKSLLLVNQEEAAQSKLQIALAANPSDPRLQALDTQIKEEIALSAQQS